MNDLFMFAWAGFGMTDIINRYQANTPFDRVDRVDRVIFRLYHKFMRTLKWLYWRFLGITVDITDWYKIGTHLGSNCDKI